MTARSEYSHTAEVQENTFMMMIDVFKEEMQTYFKEIEKKTTKN